MGHFSRKLALNLGTVSATFALVGRLSSAIASPPVELTFTEHIAPILYDKCVECHHRGGSAPFSLVTFEEVRPRARQIASITEQRLMPPWKPVEGYGPAIRGQRRLTEQQITTIQTWLRDGSREGPVGALRDPRFIDDGWQLGHPDLTIGMPQPTGCQPGGVMPSANLSCKFRCRRQDSSRALNSWRQIRRLPTTRRCE